MNGWNMGFIDRHPAIGRLLILVAGAMLAYILFGTVFAPIVAVAFAAYCVYLLFSMRSHQTPRRELVETGVSSFVFVFVVVLTNWPKLTLTAIILLIGGVLLGIGTLVMAVQQRQGNGN